MSFDPRDHDSEPPSEYDFAEPLPADRSDARQRVQAPAIALIIIGILNLLGVGYFFFNAAMATFTPANRLKDQMLSIYESFPALKAELSKRSPDEIKMQGMIFGWGAVTVSLVSAILTIVGGIRMMSLKNYALGIIGAVSTAIPCLSCSGTCCFGEAIGIWALIVLLNAEVKATFQ